MAGASFPPMVSWCLRREDFSLNTSDVICNSTLNEIEHFQLTVAERKNDENKNHELYLSSCSQVAGSNLECMTTYRYTFKTLLQLSVCSSSNVGDPLGPEFSKKNTFDACVMKTCRTFCKPALMNKFSRCIAPR